MLTISVIVPVRLARLANLAPSFSTSSAGALRCRPAAVMFRAMPVLPRAILFDLDDTLISAFGQAVDQWQRVVAEFADRLAAYRPDAVVAAMHAYSRYLWADEARHKYWRHRIGEARRHIVANGFAELCTAAGRAPPGRELCQAIADRFNELQEAELRMFPGAHET